MKNNILDIVLGALTGLGAYFGGLNWELIIIWVLLMALDIVTGVIKSFKNGNFSSREMKLGLLKKSGEFFLLLGLTLGQRAAELSGVNIPVASVLIGAFCFKELGSIIENALGMDITIPVKIMRWFKVAKEQLDTDQSEAKEENHNG